MCTAKRLDDLKDSSFLDFLSRTSHITHRDTKLI